ncbi:acetate--CoA ligase family protein, partial [Candidatus Woesearchaeota archaeon]|nr:acetate--CoA ligase family protein [Candidatus Woesearchaeota archaeon]
MQLDFNKTRKLLEKYKFPLVDSFLAKTPEELIKFSQKTGFPVVLKISSPDIIHKSDIGGVKTGIENEEELIKAYDEIIKNVKKKNKRAKIDGVLIQRMEQGIEVIVGVKKDPQFGATILFGLGGVFVEVLRDVSLRIAPVDKKEALEMMREIKGYKILEGVRGKKA